MFINSIFRNRLKLLTKYHFRCYHQIMKKLIVILLMLLFSFPVWAGQYEDALRTGKPVCLYIHVKYCKYCNEKEIYNHEHISFLYEAHKINKNDLTPIEQFFKFANIPVILVNDADNLIGG